MKLPSLKTPGLFITATDTGVGKTVATCIIANHLAKQGLRVGVCKPYASGCTKQREGLVSEDTLALAHFANTPHPLSIVTPLTFAPPLAPAVAAQTQKQSIDLAPLAHALELLDQTSDILLIEGVGGILVPLDPDNHKLTVIDLVQAINYPTLVVARPNLGTLNHTAMTHALLRQAGHRPIGTIINRHPADPALVDDPSIESNRRWIEKMTSRPVIATFPDTPEDQCQPHLGILPDSLLDAASQADWQALAKPATL